MEASCLFGERDRAFRIRGRSDTDRGTMTFTTDVAFTTDNDPVVVAVWSSPSL
jgi:hypothetical protein